MRNRLMKIVALLSVAIVMLGAESSPGARFDKIGHGMVCVCGCGQVLLECNHVGCPDSGRMIDELRQQVSLNSSDQIVYNWFAMKYGPTVLGSPMRGGFDDAAWIVPGAVFLLATLGVAFLINAWKKKQPLRAMPVRRVGPEQAALRNRIREETRYE
jgi:cytochrome c-type biogenesis protein CcmH/NrfF